MSTLPKSPTYYQLLELYLKTLGRSSAQDQYSEDAQHSGWSRSVSGSTIKSNQEISIVDQELFGSLDVDELKLVAQIIKELKMNNALWYYERKSSYQYKTVTKLVERGILAHTEDSDIYVVNPFFVRRGTELSVLAHTIKLLSTSSRVHKDLIKNLKEKNIDISGFDMLGLPNAI